MANPYDQFDAASEAKDLATSFAVGSNQLLKMAGDVYGLTTGNMDNVVSRQGQENIDYLQQGKSEKLRQAEARRKAAVDAEEGTLNQALAYARETFTDPRLFLSSTAESVPSLVGAGGIGAGARVAAGKVLAKKGAETASKIGVGTAVGAGAGMQGTSVGADQYAEVVDILQKMPEEQALQVPQIARLMTEKGATLEEAKTALALDLARSTGALASLASIGTQMLPGGRTIEKAIAGDVGKKVAGKALAGAAMGAIGEGVQEAVEEASGQAAKNVLARAVEPGREITKGVGEAMGAGFTGAAPLGAAAGAASRPSRPVPEGETTAGKSSELLASDATTSDPRTSITDTPDLSLEGAQEMSTREVGSVLSAREAAARGFEPSEEDVKTAEEVRRPRIEVSEESAAASNAPVQEALDEWRNQNPDVGVNITVVNDPNLRNTRNYGIRGYFDPNTGEVVINSAFTKPFEVESVVQHEWSHHTLASDEGRTALAEFATREIPAEELSDLAKRYPNADNLTLVEEWIARNQEKSPGVFARIVAKIREWLDGKLGIRMTNEEAARVMLRTLRERGAPVAEEAAPSLTEQPVDTASENLTKTSNEPTSVQQEEPRPERALPKSRFYVSSDERGGDFAGAIAEAARVHTKGAAVEVKSPEFYADPENHLYFSEDGRAGAVVKPDGDLVSVFKHPESTAKMRDILTDASQEATKLDGFDIDGFLPNYYSRFGFRPVARVTFNDEFAPPKWDFAENGRPDNVFMVRDPENKLGLPEYDAYADIRDSVPLVSYDEALKLQQEAVDAVASEKPKQSSVLAKQPIRESLTSEQIDAVDKRRINELDIDDLVSRKILTERHGELLSELRSASGGDSRIEVVNPEDLPPRAAAVYDPNTNTIRVSNATKSDLGRVLMHEYTHALTFMGLKYVDERVTSRGDIISATPRPGVDIRDLREASRQMDELFSIAEKAANDLGEKFYGLSNRMEFVAEAFSSKKFQNFLSSIPSTKGSKQSLFDRFVSIVKKILGTESESLLTDVIRVTDPFVGAKKTVTGQLVSEDIPGLTEEPSESEQSSVPAKQPIRESVTEEPVDVSSFRETRESLGLPTGTSKVSIEDVAKALNEFSKGKLGDQKFSDDQLAVAHGIANAVLEGRNQLMLGEKSGADWYDTDMDSAKKMLRKAIPTLKTNTDMVLFTAVMAPTSFGQNPVENLRTAVRVYQHAVDKGGNIWGNLAPRQDDGKGWTLRSTAVQYGIERLNDLVNDLGERGAVNWLLSKHPISELRKYNKNVTGNADDEKFGAYVFGPKGGPFFLNMNGIREEMTKDLWWSRTFNRWFGTMEDVSASASDKRAMIEEGMMDEQTGTPDTGGFKIRETPRNLGERQRMEAVAKGAADQLGLTVEELQATLWYYEQQLWKRLGARVESYSYSDGAKKVLAERGIQPPRIRRSDTPNEKRRQDAYALARNLGGL